MIELPDIKQKMNSIISCMRIIYGPRKYSVEEKYHQYVISARIRRLLDLARAGYNYNYMKSFPESEIDDSIASLDHVARLIDNPSLLDNESESIAVFIFGLDHLAEFVNQSK